MFESARIKLSLWYTLVLLFLTGSLSLMFYWRVTGVIEQEYERMGRRWVVEQELLPGSGMRETWRPFASEDITNTKSAVATQLLVLNAGIAVFSALASYWLSGRTLRPIEQVMEEQRRFVADAAHELRTPITALKTSLEVNLMDKRLPGKTKQILTENLEDVEGLETLSEGLLALARFDGQSRELTKVRVDKVVEQAVRQVKILAKKQGVELTLEKVDKAEVMADERSLVQLLVILLDNGVKYTPKGGKVTVEVRKSNRAVEIWVTDTGVGIAKHHLDHIFERFYRVDSARDKNETAGYGLGLSLAHKIVKELGGRIKVESKKATGSKFRVRLPRA